MVLDFGKKRKEKRMEIVVVNTYFEKEGEQRVTKRSVVRCTKVGYILYRI